MYQPPGSIVQESFYERWYHTTPSTIHVHYYGNEEYGWGEHDHQNYREINRQTLEMTLYMYNPNTGLTEKIDILGFKNDECQIFLGNANDLEIKIDEMIQKEVNKNLL